MKAKDLLKNLLMNEKSSAPNEQMKWEKFNDIDEESAALQPDSDDDDLR